MFWLIIIAVVVVAAVVLLAVLGSAEPGQPVGATQPPGARPASPAAIAALPHRSNRPSFDHLDRLLATESSFAARRIYIFGQLAEQVYETSMREQGFDLLELEDFVDRVCSRFVELRSEDPGYAEAQIAEWTGLVGQTSARNGLDVSQIFRRSWLERHPPAAGEDPGQDSVAVTRDRYLESDRADDDNADYYSMLLSLAPVAAGFSDGFGVPSKVKDDLSQLGAVGFYERVEQAAIAVRDNGRGGNTPRIYTEILGICWNMQRDVGRDTVAHHRADVLRAMDGQPAHDLEPPGRGFLQACRDARPPD